MLWNEALDSLKQGKMVTRSFWAEEKKYLMLIPGMQSIMQVTHKGPQGANVAHWLPTIPDYDAQDWDFVEMAYSAPVVLAPVESEPKAA